MKKKFDSTPIEYGRVSAKFSANSEGTTKVALDIETIMHTQRAMEM